MLAAQDAMRDVAILINERKRRMENVGMIGFWQETIESWKVSTVARTGPANFNPNYNTAHSLRLRYCEVVKMSQNVPFAI